MASVIVNLMTSGDNPRNGHLVFGSVNQVWAFSSLHAPNLFPGTGSYRIEGARTVLTRLNDAHRIGHLEVLDPAHTSEGRSGQGISDITADHFTWDVFDVAPFQDAKLSSEVKEALKLLGNIGE